MTAPFAARLVGSPPPRLLCFIPAPGSQELPSLAFLGHTILVLLIAGASCGVSYWLISRLAGRI